MTTPIKRCDTCRWWTPSTHDGLCHRHAPVIIPTSDEDQRGYFPLTAMDHWCGDWAKKSAPATDGSTPPPAK